MLKVLFVVSMVALIGSFADAMLKLGTKDSGGVLLRYDTIKDVFRNRWIILGISLMAFNTIIWIRVLSFVELSVAYPLYATSYIFAAMWSMLIFKEEIPLRRWIGIFVIILGVYVVSKG